MKNILVQYPIEGDSANEIVHSIELGVQEGRLRPGEPLPTIRDLARLLGVSPGTVSAAYHLLRIRGVAVGRARVGTHIAPRPPLLGHPSSPIPPGARDLATGSPDPAFLPPLRPVFETFAAEDLTPVLYREHVNSENLMEIAGRALMTDGLPAGNLAVMGGALDAIDRLLAAHAHPGDRVVVEDPGYPGVLDLVGAHGMVAVPVPVDDRGPMPDALATALRAGAKVLVVTPRAQNPSGAALDPARVGELSAVLADSPNVLVIEDDHAGPVSGSPATLLTRPDRPAWAVVRSVSKTLGPDLRLAVVTGDALTLSRLEGRQRLGTGWVSTILQEVVAALWRDDAAMQLVGRATLAYRERREALLDALARRGIAAHGRSGLNVWIPVPEEAENVRLLGESGWAVSAGSRFRIRTPPAIRVTISTLQPEEAEQLAEDLARTLAGSRTYYA